VEPLNFEIISRDNNCHFYSVPISNIFILMHALRTRLFAIIITSLCLLSSRNAVAQIHAGSESLWLSSKKTIDVSAIIKKSSQLIDKGAYDSAISTCKQGLLLCDNTSKGQLKMSALYNYIGASFQFKGEFDSAIQYFYKAVEKSEHIDSGKLQLLRAYNNISLTFNRTRNNEKALIYLEKAEGLARKNRWNGLLPAMYLNKGRIYKEQKKFELSEATFLSALAACDTTPGVEKSSGIPKDVIRLMIFTNLGQLNLNQHRPIKALKYLQTGLPLSENVNPYYQVPIRLALGKVYHQLRNFKLAKKYVLLAISKAGDAEINDGLSEGHLLISEIYNQEGKYKQAYNHLQKAYVLEEKIRGVEITESSRLLEIKYRTAQKDNEIVEKKLSVIEKDRMLKNRNIWIIAISLGLFFLIIFFIIVYKNHQHRQGLQEQKILSIEQDRRIEILKATAEGEEKERNRIASNLHDGIGSIISAAKMNFSTLRTNDTDKPVFEKSMKLLNEAAFELRTTAHNLMPQMLLQEGLVTATRDFCERVSNSQLLLIEYQAYGNFCQQEVNFELFVYRIIQELINNIIKHAAAQKALVQISMSNDLLSITVEDNGKGMAPDELNKGAGLKNLEAKVYMLHGQITIESVPQSGTQIYIEFDLTKNKRTL
jgi:signal transduction histidine kinase